MADWPDWRGDTAIIVATGPSAAASSLNEAQGLARVIAVNGSWQLAPWADVLYACDRSWWMDNDGIPEFKGLKIAASAKVSTSYPFVKIVSLVNGDKILTAETGRIGCGLRTGNGHSGFHAINLAVQFGARKLLLVGFDMRVDCGLHWHADDRKAWRTDPRQMEECRVALDGCASQFKLLGVEVVNCSTVSALKNYPKMKLVEALA